MIEVLSLLLAAAIGCTWLWSFLPAQPIVFRISLGWGFGGGATSVLYYLLLLTGIASRISLLTVEVLLLAAGIALTLRRKEIEPSKTHASLTMPVWVLAGTLCLCLLLFLIAFLRLVQANPQGQWDALAIWNVRAKFLAGGAATWRYAVSPLLSRTHPDYPLLLSASIARGWTYAGAFSTASPVALALLYSLGILGLLVSGVARLRGTIAGLMAGLLSFTAVEYWRAVPSQYADIPLSFYVLSGLLLLSCDAVVLSGIFCSLAAWTKDEGLVFTLIVTVILALAAWRKLPRFLAGAAPGLAVAVTFKLFVAPSANVWVHQTLPAFLSRCFEGARHLAIVKAFLVEFWNLSPGFANPILIFALLAILLGVHRRAGNWLVTATLAAMLLVDYVAYLTTPNDLAFQIGGSIDRVVFQLWPSLVLCAFLWLSEIKPIPAPPAQHSKTRKDSRSG